MTLRRPLYLAYCRHNFGVRKRIWDAAGTTLKWLSGFNGPSSDPSAVNPVAGVCRLLSEAGAAHQCAHGSGRTRFLPYQASVVHACLLGNTWVRLAQSITYLGSIAQP
jgi:hypothetical protein